jgi:enoyl-CoA hydratase
MTESSDLDVETRDGVQTWTMNFAPVNAIGPRSLAALHAQLTETIADESIVAVVLASGQRVFSAGADAKWMAEVAADRGPDALLEEFVRTMEGFRELSLRLRKSPVLVIAVLNGHTLAGGLELAAACDLRFCADDNEVRIGVPEMELFGQMPSGGGGVQFLARLMGPGRALQFILDAGPVTPARAYDLGLLDRLCRPSEVLGDAQAFAAKVARHTTRIGVAATKRAVFGGIELSLADALDLDRAVHWDSVRRGGFAETTSRFVDRFASGSR